MKSIAILSSGLEKGKQRLENSSLNLFLLLKEAEVVMFSFKGSGSSL